MTRNRGYNQGKIVSEKKTYETNLRINIRLQIPNNGMRAVTALGQVKCFKKLGESFLVTNNSF